MENNMARRGSSRSSDVVMSSWDNWFENWGSSDRFAKL